MILKSSNAFAGIYLYAACGAGASAFRRHTTELGGGHLLLLGFLCRDHTVASVNTLGSTMAKVWENSPLWCGALKLGHSLFNGSLLAPLSEAGILLWSMKRIVLRRVSTPFSFTLFLLLFCRCFLPFSTRLLPHGE